MFSLIQKTLLLVVTFIRYIGLIAFIQMQMLYPIYATVNIAIINKSGSNTNKLNSANGIPIINIDKVNSNGQSFNDYDYFDVGKEGLIFNNSSALSQTELAGWIAGNSNLKENQSATLIVNTVRSKRSELGGYMEVAGNKADVIILNSNGITCDGCGFLNTNKAVLSTGEAILNNGSLSGISVSKGEIVIGRGGLNAEKANRIDIISQSLRLNGQLRGKEVNVSLGGQDYNYSSGNSTSNGLNENSNYVISSSEFGGMYGDSIRLVSHNKSLGVNIDFNMATSGSKLEVDSAGNLTISGKLSSKGDTTIKGSDVYITNNSEITSLSKLNLAGNSLNFSGKINSKLGLNLNFNNLYTFQQSSIQSMGDISIIANIQGKFTGDVLGSSNIFLKGGEINFLSNVTSAKNLSIEGNSVNVGSEATIYSTGNTTFSANSLDVFGKIVSSQKLELNSKDIYLQNGSIMQGLNVSVDATNLDLKSGSSITSIEDFLVNLQGNFNLNEGVLLAANRDFSMTANSINLYAGANLSANGKMNLVANNLYVGIGNDVSKNDNKITTLSSKGDLSLNIANESNIQAKGNVTSKGLLTFKTSTLNNRGFIAGEDINFKVDYLNNLGHERIGNSYNSYDNAGVIYAVNSLNIEGFNGGRAKHVLNSSSKIQTQNGDININADIFENTLTWWHIYESISEWNTIYENKMTRYEKIYEDIPEYWYRYLITRESLYEQYVTYQLYGSKEATLFSGGKLNINADEFINRSSSISSAGVMSIDAKNFRNETLAKQNYTNIKTWKQENIFYSDMDFTKFYFGQNNIQDMIELWGLDRNENESDSAYIARLNKYIRENDVKPNYDKMVEICARYADDDCVNRVSDPTNNQYKKLNDWNYLQSSLISSASDINIKVEENFNNGNIEENQNIGKGENIDYDSGTKIKEEGFNAEDIVDGNMFYLGDGTSGYLIETNPYFTDLQKFKGSAYYLSLLGLKDDDLMLGDGFVDLEAVRQQLLDQIGKELIDGYKSPEEQLEALMEAGLSAKEALGLILGQAPSEDQLSKLNQPIVWWVRQEINGQSVLVPQVFFPTDYKPNVPPTQGESSIIGGGHVEVGVGGDASNSGTIIGEEGVSIGVGGDFNNSGTIGDANNGEYHQEQMENISDKIEKDIKEAEKLQKEYEEQAEEYKKTNDLYTSKANKYEELLAKYNQLVGSVGNKYAGKVWAGDAKVSTQRAEISEEVEELSKKMETLAEEIKPLAETLKVKAEDLNTKGENLNNLSEDIKKQVEDLESYVDNIKGVEIEVGGDFVQNGLIEANKLIADVGGKLTSLEGVTNTTFQTTLNAKQIELVGAKVSSSQLEMNAKDISIIAKEEKDKNGYTNKLVSSEITGGNIKLNSENDIYISSSNVIGNTISLEAGKDITITAQSLEHKLSDKELKDEKILYTDINTKEIKEGTIENAKKLGNLEVEAFREESIGSNIVANESLTITGENIGVYGSTLYSDGLLALDAKDTLEIGTIEDTTHIGYELSQSKTEKSGKWHKKKKTTTKIKDTGSVDYTSNVGSTILGGSVYLGSGGDMNIIGSVIGNAEKDEEAKKENSESQNSENKPIEEVKKEDASDNTVKIGIIEEPKAWEGIKQGDIIINSGANLNIKGAADKKNNSLYTDIDVKTVSAGIGSVVDTIKNLDDSFKELGKSLGSISNPFDVAGAVNAGSGALGAVGSLTNIVSFSASIEKTNTQVNHNQQSSTYAGSTIIGDNIKISSKGDALVKGSAIIGSGDVDIDTKGNLNVEAGENTFNSSTESSSKTSTTSVSVGVNITGTVSGSASYSYGESQSSTTVESKNYSGSLIQSGGDMNVKVGNNMNLIGSNLSGKNVSVDAKDVHIESLQDYYKTESNYSNSGFSVGIGSNTSSGGNGSLGVSYGKGESMLESKTTNNVAGIKASGSSNIKANSITETHKKDEKYEHKQGFNLSYSKSFSGQNKDNANAGSKGGVIGSLNNTIQKVDNVNSYVPNVSATMYGDNYNVTVSPSEWLGNTSGAFSAVRDYTVAGSSVVKVGIKTYNSLKDNGEVSFTEAYGHQNKIDEVQKISREKDINFLNNSEDYSSLVSEAGIVEENYKTIVYSDSTLEAGYSHKEEAEIGFNLQNGNTFASGSELENTYWHEATHQADKTNIKQEDRENYATNMGNSAEHLGGINNWLYGDGGLNNISIGNYYLKNQNTLQLNNDYVSNLNPNDLEYSSYVVNNNGKNIIVQATKYPRFFSKEITGELKNKLNPEYGEKYLTIISTDREGFSLVQKTNDWGDFSQLSDGSIDSVTKIEHEGQTIQQFDDKLYNTAQSYDNNAKFGVEALSGDRVSSEFKIKETGVVIGGIVLMSATGGYATPLVGSIFYSTFSTSVEEMVSFGTNYLFGSGYNSNSFNNTVLTMSGATNINQISIPSFQTNIDMKLDHINFKNKFINNSLPFFDEFYKGVEYYQAISKDMENKYIPEKHFNK